MATGKRAPGTASRAALRPALGRIVVKALEVNPNLRHQTAADARRQQWRANGPGQRPGSTDNCRRTPDAGSWNDSGLEAEDEEFCGTNDNPPWRLLVEA